MASKEKKKKKGVQVTIRPESKIVDNTATEEPKPDPDPIKPVGGDTSNSPEIIRDTEGNVKGVSLPNGKNVLGINREEAFNIANDYLGKKVNIPAGTIEQTEASKLRDLNQEQVAKEENTIQSLEETGVLARQEAGIPKEVDLTPTGADFDAAVPVIGASSTSIVESGVLSSIIDFFTLSNPLTKYLPDEINPSITPIEAEDVARAEIDRRVREKGLSNNEKLGATVEAIPVLSGINSWAGGLINTPEGSVSDERKDISKLTSDLRNMQEKITIRKIDPFLALGDIAKSKELIDELESKIRVNINASARLRTNPDEVNNIQREIYEARKTLFITEGLAAVAAIEPRSLEPASMKTVETLELLKNRNRG